METVQQTDTGREYVNEERGMTREYLSVCSLHMQWVHGFHSAAPLQSPGAKADLRPAESHGME